jgi:hypothetical protein
VVVCGAWRVRARVRLGAVVVVVVRWCVGACPRCRVLEGSTRCSGSGGGGGGGVVVCEGVSSV